MDHAEKLKQTVMNEGAYAAAVHNLKDSKPAKGELVQIVKDLTGLPVRTSTTVKELYRQIERHGAAERRHEARAEVSRQSFRLERREPWKSDTRGPPHLSRKPGSMRSFAI